MNRGQTRDTLGAWGNLCALFEWGSIMNPDNLRSLADLPPERRREIARMGGKASGIERARRAYMKQSAREIILKMHYFYEAEEELEAEWKEFQRWRRRKRNTALHSSKQFIDTIRTRVAVSTYSERGCSNGTESTQADRPAGHKRGPCRTGVPGMPLP